MPEFKNPHLKEWNCIQTGKNKSFWEEFKILHRNKIELIGTVHMLLQYKYITELNNRKNRTDSQEIILVYRNVAAGINFRISKKQFNLSLKYKFSEEIFLKRIKCFCRNEYE